MESKERIAIIGGGPSALFLYKRLIEGERKNITINIFEANNALGEGMPYSTAGANKEHITNVSGNEIPDAATAVSDWVASVPALTKQYNIDTTTYNDYKVLPRLLFGEYLKDQFRLLLQQGEQQNITSQVHLNCKVLDIADVSGKVVITLTSGEHAEFDKVIICTGHHWPVTFEGKVPGYYDSPYPPAKLRSRFNHPIAITGSSLTAIDAIRTLARHHGNFVETSPGVLAYHANADAGGFRIVMHSRHGLLPAIRFHLEDPHLSKETILSREAIDIHMKGNGGFLSLDFIFEKDFKDSFKEKDSDFYEHIKTMNIEAFVESMMNQRESVDPFLFFKGEYAEAKKSIRRKQSVYWKEMLAVLSFAMNYPAKHLSAEDMLRLQHVLMPLISIVIAFVPQTSCEELIALHDAGLLELIAVGDDGIVEPGEKAGIIYHYTDKNGTQVAVPFQTYINCAGQRHLSMNDFPFKSLLQAKVVSEAKLQFRSSHHALKLQDHNKDIIQEGDHYFLRVPGIAVTDNFNLVDESGVKNPRIYMMAVPYMAGYNPDYSGLDFCEEASKLIVRDMFS